jgi:hypothetical protein
VGGQNNCITHNCATVAGFGVASVMDCAFHANILVAPNSPNFVFGGFPTGTLQYVVAPAILGFPAGTCMVLIA